MLVLRFNTDDSVLLWVGASRQIVTRDSLLLNGEPVVFVLRRPRATGTHGIFIVAVAWYRKGKPVIGLDSDSAVKVQHSMHFGTDAGVNWIRPRR